MQVSSRDRQDAGQRRVSVAGLPSERRLKAWADAIYDSYYPLDLSSPAADFTQGELSIVDLPGARFCLVDCDAMQVERRRCHLGLGGDYYMLPIPQRRPLTLQQSGRLAEIRQGDVGLIATAAPYRYLQPSTNRLTTLRVGGEAARQRLSVIDDMTAVTLSGQAPLVRIFVDFVASLVRQRNTLSAAEAEALVPQLMDLMALAFTAPVAAFQSDESAVRLAHLRRLYRVVDARLEDERLGPDMLAAELGLSRRYLQKLLSARGETVSGTIRARRLAVARRRLADPALRGQTIATIAYGLGFSDPAHFSRVFKAETGLSPRDYRQRHLAAGAA